MTDVVEELPEVGEIPDDIEETIQHLRGQLTRMGAINPDAPAEFEELQDRHLFLVAQVEDLEETSERLSQIIEELDELTSRSFGEMVKRVDGEFRQVFTRLFGGGSAQLLLTDPEDIAISGVDIVARLPGRREQNLGLLSGGERALTAAALIFSLLRVSPTPFCVLDEVDAMLDEANIRRFRELLCELSVDTQLELHEFRQPFPTISGSTPPLASYTRLKTFFPLIVSFSRKKKMKSPNFFIDRP